MKDKPTFAFVTIGSGSYLGSTVRDLILANQLHRRGFNVIIYWMMECNSNLADKGVQQRMLCHGTRYQFRRPSDILDRIIGRLLFLPPQKFRIRITQSIAGFVDRLMEHLVCSLNEMPDADPILVNRLIKYMKQDQVDYLMMSFASISPLAQAAKQKGSHSFEYLVSFQGDEEFANYARRAGIFEKYRQRLDESLLGSPWPAIAVSQDYLNRIVDELKIDESKLRVLYNGVELPEQKPPPPFSILKTVFPNLDENIPLVSYIGRQDIEKGIDLLLYAAKQLETKQIPIQLVICGSTAKSISYQNFIVSLSEHLRLTIHHSGVVSTEIRNALYVHSHCIVYPSINREPFGLVAAEAMSYGTPMIVPDLGGISEVIHWEGKQGGITFNTWGSDSLANQIEQLLTNEQLYIEISANTRTIAENFSADKMADAVLEYMNIDSNYQ